MSVRSRQVQWLRKTAWARMACALVMALSSSACAGFATTVFAPHHEYEAYRSVRTSRDLEQRLQASAQYLKRYPQGRWEASVRPWYLRAEARYYVRRKDSIAGLIGYLRVLPSGPHAEEAKARLAALQERERMVVAERLMQEAEFTEQRLAERARGREAARDAFALWLGRLMAIDTWGERTSHLDHETLFAWRLDEPQGRCVDHVCTKLVQLPYELPGGGDQAKRVMVLEVVLELDPGQGVLRQARLRGPGLFSRLWEATHGQAARPSGASRVTSIAFAAEVVRGAIEARLPKARCDRQPVAPVVIDRACDGWSVVMRVPEEPAGDDEIIIMGPPAL